MPTQDNLIEARATHERCHPSATGNGGAEQLGGTSERPKRAASIDATLRRVASEPLIVVDGLPQVTDRQRAAVADRRDAVAERR